MAKRKSWYETGFQDALDGLCDPPWQPGHRDHTSYMEGQRDGERQLDREADKAAANV